MCPSFRRRSKVKQGGRVVSLDSGAADSKRSLPFGGIGMHIKGFPLSSKDSRTIPKFQNGVRTALTVVIITMVETLSLKNLQKNLLERCTGALLYWRCVMATESSDEKWHNKINNELYCGKRLDDLDRQTCDNRWCSFRERIRWVIYSVMLCEYGRRKLFWEKEDHSTKRIGPSELVKWNHKRLYKVAARKNFQWSK